MMWRCRLSLALVSALALSATACGSDPVSPTAPTPVSTEDFAGTIDPLGTNIHTFTVKAVGPLTVLLTSVSPLATLAVGVSIGGWDGTTCTAVAANHNARAGTASVLSGTANVGNFCVQVYDSGNFTEPVTYAIQVSHP